MPCLPRWSEGRHAWANSPHGKPCWSKGRHTRADSRVGVSIDPWAAKARPLLPCMGSSLIEQHCVMAHIQHGPCLALLTHGNAPVDWDHGRNACAQRPALKGRHSRGMSRCHGVRWHFCGTRHGWAVKEAAAWICALEKRHEAARAE
ncbi:hypothetical protein BC831DRAFT_490989 [Entophlyctis helioformis]|nr:hypothetical protein BC831DRAFT_490989 [Entophlyctis helioformis]